MSQARNLSGFLAKVLASGDLTDSGVDAVKLGGKDSSYYLDYNNFTNAPAGGTDSATVSSIITADVDAAFINALTIDADTLGGQNSAYYLNYNNLGNQPNILDSTNVSSIITADVDATFINALTIDADTLGGNAGSYYLDYTNFTNTPTLPVLGTDFVDSTEARGLISVTDLGGDGSLTYTAGTGILTYTGPSAAEVQAHISAGTGVTVSSGQISIGQAVGTTDNVTFNDMIVSGDLTVSGTTTTVNSNTVHIGDNIISLNHDETGTPSQDAGIEIERGTSTNKTLVWDETNDKWTVGSETFVAGMFEGSVAATTLTADSATLGAVEGFSHLKAPHSATTKTYTVTVASKTSAHRYNGTGSGNGFVIDGMEAPFLTLTPGRTYRFDQADATNSGHPLRFYYDAAKNDSYTANITTAGTAGSAGAYTDITITDDTPLVLHYQCSAHSNMGNAVQTNARNLTGFTTDDLAQGTSNLYGGGGTDSAATISLIESTVDSAYVNSKIVSGSTITTTNSTVVKYARLELTANQSIPSTTQTILNFNTRSVDNSTANLLTTTLGSGKFIIPAGVTKVRLKASANGSSVTDQFIIKILKNGSNAVTTNFDISSTGGDFPAVFTGIESVVEGDYFQVSAYSQNSRTVNAGSLTWYELEVLEGSILDDTSQIAVNLSALNDVDSSSPSDGQALVWDSANSYWKPGAVASGSGTVDSAQTISLARSSLSITTSAANAGGSLGYNNSTGIFTFVPADVSGGGVSVAASYVEDYSTTIYTATAGLTTFNASSSPALPAYTAGKIGVFVNGVKRTDFTATDGTSVVMTNALALNDHVEIINFGGPLRSAQDPLTETKFTATAGQTTFALNYTAGHITVFLNGAKLSADDYTATNGTSVVLTTGAALNDVVEVIEHGVAFATPYSATNYTKGVSGNVSGNTVSSLNYTPGKEAVYLNGIKLLSGDDYTTVDSGSSITFINNIVDSDRIEVVDHGIVTEATLGLDSAAAINLIDSDYVSARAGSGGVTTGKAIAMAIVFG